MAKPILSICIPTRNRADYLNNTILSIVTDKIFQNTDKIEVIISDNCSDDDTQFVALKYKNLYPDKIVYVRRDKDLQDKNFIETLKIANGKYAKLNNDTVSFDPEKLEEVVKILDNTDSDALFFLNNEKENNSLSIKKYSNFDNFLKEASYKCTWIGGLCVKTDAYKQLENPDRFSYLNFAQIDILARLGINGITMIEGKCLSTVEIPNKGGYSIPKVFGENLILILKQLMNEYFITSATYDKVIKSTLLEFVNFYHFNYNNKYTFSKGGYFKYLFKYYKTKPYYYLNYVKHLLKLFCNFFIFIQNDGSYKSIKILRLIKFRKRRFLYTKKGWRKKNRHNFINLSDYNNVTRISAGKSSYGTVDAIFSDNSNFKLIIGNYCSIASGVKFIVSSEHPYKCLSTYPFKVYNLGYKYEALSKGNIIIKDDVWIGTNAMILSGVSIGQGAIIGAGAIVTKDIPPYAIVGGNPAKVIKYRFEPDVIEKLVKFDFSKLTDKKIRQLGTRLYTKITSENVDKLLEEFTSNV